MVKQTSMIHEQHARFYRHMNEAVIRLLVTILPLYFKYFPVQRGKPFVWQTIVMRRMLRRMVWRHFTVNARSRLGIAFEGEFPDMVPSYIHFFGVWEPAITRYLIDRLRDGDIFIDVGANVGYYTLLASRFVGPNGRVFAIEAARDTYAKLQRNLVKNAATNVRTFHVAVGERSGMVPVWLNQGDSSGTTTVSHVADLRKSLRLVETVEAKPLYEIIDQEIIRKARFIKIDVEGAEWNIVKSLRNLLPTLSAQTEFIIEVSKTLVRRSGGSARELVDCFTEAGYEPFVIPNRYDSGFLVHKVRTVKLQPLREWTSDQLDLVFKRPEPIRQAKRNSGRNFFR